MKVKVSEATGPALDWLVAVAEHRVLKRSPMGPQGGHGWWIWEEATSGRGGVLLGKCVYLPVGPRTSPKTRNSGEVYSPSTDWSQGGPLLKSNRISIMQKHDGWWRACIFDLNDDLFCLQLADDPLIAAMRCFVASKLGDEVDVPEELL